ncbi:hypothetical protein NPIL_628211 [Nephila pilipes]|uniref:Uncharacterized protein n=1 Tax=Nephila pilipes TaxID=299642 RepID=A0A8X6PE57_NEPPI|nr:hypothetical protein NPIL_628211 [Nephila pilipes]
MKYLQVLRAAKPPTCYIIKAYGWSKAGELSNRLVSGLTRACRSGVYTSRARYSLRAKIFSDIVEQNWAPDNRTRKESQKLRNSEGGGE